MHAALKKIEKLLHVMVERNASDLLLECGGLPVLRIDGALTTYTSEAVSQSQLHEMVCSILSLAQQERFEKFKEIDFSYNLPGVSRYRGNALLQQGTPAAVFHAIPNRPFSLKELGFQHLQEFCKMPRGLILVTGQTGAGKSTTLAAMIDHINETQTRHIITIEDPIEYVHGNKKSVVWQRELGNDTLSYAAALKHVLRQDPDVILVGELRDLETISLAITAAETGHLVLATLHTLDSAQSVDRIIDVFPPPSAAAGQSSSRRNPPGDYCTASPPQEVGPRQGLCHGSNGGHAGDQERDPHRQDPRDSQHD